MRTRLVEHTFEEALLSDTICVVDLGACQGEFAREFCTLFPQFHKYIMVEANKRLASQLIENFTDNRFAVIDKACYSAPRTFLQFNVDPSPWGSSYVFSGSDSIQVATGTITLQEVINNFGLSKIDLLKIDIEGGEWDVLPWFDKRTFEIISQITVEFHDFIDQKYLQRTLECVAHLRDLGYDLEAHGT